ncbi:MAG: Maf family protein [Syntrophomonadaceae bacterium]
MNIILASASPRRKKLLEDLGLSFITRSTEIDETFLPGEFPRDAVRRLASHKAKAAISQAQGDYLVIAADTVVVFKDQALGKPTDQEDAWRKLNMLSGNCHEVITAVSIMTSAGNCEVEDEITRVYFRHLSEEEIRSYVVSGEPMDKAGAYGIQGKGAFLIEKIEGCYFNVVGLPLAKLYQMLQRYGINLMGA